jgi:hypothetical protein
MTKREIIGLVNGKVICCEERLNVLLEFFFASDLMSEVTAIEIENQHLKIRI